MHDILYRALHCIAPLDSHPGVPLCISPQVNPDKTVTFRYLAPLAKEVKLSGQFQKGACGDDQRYSRHLEYNRWSD